MMNTQTIEGYRAGILASAQFALGNVQRIQNPYCVGSPAYMGFQKAVGDSIKSEFVQ